jgi:GDPmannose 4,6-dehydratase
MLQLQKPDDFIICTGEVHSVRAFIEEAFECVGITIIWKGNGLDEVGYDKKTGIEYVGFDPQFFRPSKTAALKGNASKARSMFGFNPAVGFKELVKIMVTNDLRESERAGDV